MSCSALEVTDARRATEGPGNWMCEIFDNLAFQLCDGYSVCIIISTISTLGMIVHTYHR